MGWIFGISRAETCNKVVFKSLDGSFCGILAMDMWRNKLLGDLFLRKGLLEDNTSFIIYYMEPGLVSSSCECVKEFLDPFVDVCA